MSRPVCIDCGRDRSAEGIAVRDVGEGRVRCLPCGERAPTADERREARARDRQRRTDFAPDGLKHPEVRP